MTFIKYHGSRINLNNIVEYKDAGNNKIKFYYAATDESGRQKSKYWRFDSEAERDEVLKEIDNLCIKGDAKKVGSIDGSGSEDKRVGSENSDNVVDGAHIT